jgi:glycosyltransferase involved in cell wall biosynthesis
MGQRLHICHISLLNPAIHSRIFFKMALSQVRAGYRVSIIAQDPAPAPYLREGIEIIPLGVFGRLSWRRIWYSWRFSKLAQRVQADIYQIHTVELLGAGKKLKKALPRCQVVFDMHEDYVANILFADYYPKASRPKLAARVKAVQENFCKWGDGLILAEECFQGILPFPSERTIVAANKFQAPSAVAPPRLVLQDPNLPMMLCTGTIAMNWGIFRAVDLWVEMNKFQPINLVVAGHSQDDGVIDAIQNRVKTNGLAHRFALVGGTTYVPYEELVALIKVCTFGVALYQLKENIKDRIPTKFYEFMAAGKPLIFSENPIWESLNRRSQFGVAVPEKADADSVRVVLSKLAMLSSALEVQPLRPEVWSWDSEAPKMLDLMRRLSN